jgi:hypothetical protein
MTRAVRPWLRRYGRTAVIGVVALSLWMAGSVPWGLAVQQLVVFAAPGALLGLGASWMSFAAQPARWTWHSGRSGALWGALVLPPFIAFLIALDGQARPHQLVIGFVRAAWLAFALGLAFAVTRALRSEQRGEEVGADLQQAFTSRTTQETIERDLPRQAQIGSEYAVQASGDV